MKKEVEMKKKNDYFSILDNLEKNCSCWGDFLKPKYHPNSLISVETSLIDDDENSFGFAGGEKLMKAEMRNESVLDNLHWVLEECDSVQGFQLFSDTNGRSGGMSNELLTSVIDYCGGKSTVCAFLIGDSMVPSSMMTMAILELFEKCSLMIPLKIPRVSSLRFLNPKPENLFHTSAVLASAISSFSEPSRRIENRIPFHKLIEDLRITNSLKFTSLATSLPCGVGLNSSDATCLQ